jgi:hypothetical protein
LIPHVGGRRCNLGWHHPKLERLLEIGSAWGLFEWLLRDAVNRGWKLGVCANSDEHRGRCGGGVPGTAVFGTKGGLTGVLSKTLDRVSVGEALRARHTFATTGERLVGLLSTDGGAIQGDEVEVKEDFKAHLKYAFYGSNGFSSIEAFNATGRIFHRDLWLESARDRERTAWTTLRVTWGGARLYDRYREAIWDGTIEISGATIAETVEFGGISYIPEGETIKQVGDSRISFQARTSGDFDGTNLSFSQQITPKDITVKGYLGGYVKVGNALKWNPHKAQPTFLLEATWEEALQPGGKSVEIKGGADLFVRVEVIPDVNLPTRVEGTFYLNVEQAVETAIYFVGREWDGGKVITSPLFFR